MVSQILNWTLNANESENKLLVSVLTLRQKQTFRTYMCVSDRVFVRRSGVWRVVYFITHIVLG